MYKPRGQNLGHFWPPPQNSLSIVVFWATPSFVFLSFFHIELIGSKIAFVVEDRNLFCGGLLSRRQIMGTHQLLKAFFSSKKSFPD